MKFVLVIVAAILFLLFSMWQGVKQSKKTTGKIGQKMIGMWNKAYTPLFHYALRQIPIRENDIVLDIGIGGGVSTLFISEKLDTGKVYGIDYAPEAVASAAYLNAQGIEIGRVEIANASVLELSYPNDLFTLVTAFQTHFH